METWTLTDAEVKELAERHKERNAYLSFKTVCTACGAPWPCDVKRLLDHAEALEGYLENCW